MRRAGQNTRSKTTGLGFGLRSGLAIRVSLDESSSYLPGPKKRGFISPGLVSASKVVTMLRLLPLPGLHPASTRTLSSVKPTPPPGPPGTPAIKYPLSPANLGCADQASPGLDTAHRPQHLCLAVLPRLPPSPLRLSSWKARSTGPAQGMRIVGAQQRACG